MRYLRCHVASRPSLTLAAARPGDGLPSRAEEDGVANLDGGAARTPDAHRHMVASDLDEKDTVVAVVLAMDHAALDLVGIALPVCSCGTQCELFGPDEYDHCAFEARCAMAELHLPEARLGAAVRRQPRDEVRLA